MLTIAKLSRWSINYYNDTAKAVGQAAKDAQKAGGGLGEYYTEHDTRTPVWLCAGDTRTAATLVGLTDIAARRRRGRYRGGGALARRWRGAQRRVWSRVRNPRCARVRSDVLRAQECVADPRAACRRCGRQSGRRARTPPRISEAMEYLAAHAGYTRVHNPVTGEKDLVRLPGLVAIAYQHETSRAGDPHLHTHVIVPNRQARHDGQLVSIDGTSLYHEARAAGVIYQATLRRELHRSTGGGMDGGGPRHRHGRGRRHHPRNHHRVVATLHPTAPVGGRKFGRGGRPPALASPARGRAEGDPPGQTRTARLGRVAAAVARR